MANITVDCKLGEPTGSEPCTLDEVKKELKLDGITADDTLITALISAARSQLEVFTGLSLVGREVNTIARLDGCNMFELPYGPIDKDSLQVSALNPGNQAATSLNSNQYSLYGDQFVNLVAKGPVYDPILSGGHVTGIFALTYDAGYTTVPKALKQAVIQQTVYLYEHRGDEVEDLQISATAWGLAKSFRRVVG